MPDGGDPAKDPPALRPPQQTRSRQTLDRILAAGAELLIERGFDGITLQEVSARSGVSIGSIYARAPNKRALVFAVLQYADTEFRADMEKLLIPARWEGLGLEDLIRGVVRELTEVWLRHEPLRRVIINQAGVDVELRRVAGQQIPSMARQWQQVVLDHRDEILHPNPELAVDIVFRMIYATIVRRVGFGANFGAHVAIDDEMLITGMGDVAVAYLVPPQPPR